MDQFDPNFAVFRSENAVTKYIDHVHHAAPTFLNDKHVIQMLEQKEKGAEVSQPISEHQIVWNGNLQCEKGVHSFLLKQSHKSCLPADQKH